jgi:DNA invertase Pin-like site-specific DNA recombinase
MNACLDCGHEHVPDLDAVDAVPGTCNIILTVNATRVVRCECRTARVPVEYGYARVSTRQQDLTRQLRRLEEVGIPPDRIYVDKKTGATTWREGLDALLLVVQPGDLLTACTLDRVARDMRSTLNLVHELPAAGKHLRTLDDPIPIDTRAGLDSGMNRIAFLLMSLFAEMERVWLLERQASAKRNGRAPGRKFAIPPERLADARKLLDTGAARSVREAARLMGLPHATLHRSLRSRP